MHGNERNWTEGVLVPHRSTNGVCVKHAVQNSSLWISISSTPFCHSCRTKCGVTPCQDAGNLFLHECERCFFWLPLRVFNPSIWQFTERASFIYHLNIWLLYTLCFFILKKTSRKIDKAFIWRQRFREHRSENYKNKLTVCVVDAEMANICISCRIS